jgi:hypothetical protein
MMNENWREGRAGASKKESSNCELYLAQVPMRQHDEELELELRLVYRARTGTLDSNCEVYRRRKVPIGGKHKLEGTNLELELGWRGVSKLEGDVYLELEVVRQGENVSCISCRNWRGSMMMN